MNKELSLMQLLALQVQVEILNPEKLFAPGTENYQAYAVAKHRHYPEMLNQIRIINKDIDLLFVPHLKFN